MKLKIIDFNMLRAEKTAQYCRRGTLWMESITTYRRMKMVSTTMVPKRYPATFIIHFSEIRRTCEERAQNKPQPGNWPNQESSPKLLGKEQYSYHIWWSQNPKPDRMIEDKVSNWTIEMTELVELLSPSSMLGLDSRLAQSRDWDSSGTFPS